MSTYMLQTASSRLKRQIRNKKVDLVYGNVEYMPFPSDFFDSVFHVNCFYFWPSMQHALAEILRVMKPGGVMITAMNMKSLRSAKAKGLMQCANIDPLKYMCALELMGFENVKMEYLTEGTLEFQAIFAHVATQKMQPDMKELEEAQQAAEEREGKL